MTPRTHCLTLVVQRVSNADDVRREFARALIEYARDLRRGHAGNGVFERHINGGCRIEAIASLPPVLGGEAREDIVAADGFGALAQRVRDVEELATYLPGGENATEIGAALGYTAEQAAAAVRAKIAEIVAALPEEG